MDLQRVPSDGIFRNPQAFALLSVDNLLDKMRWEFLQLQQAQWNEDLGAEWPQIVSYIAANCAASIWHAAEWIALDTRAIEPTARLSGFLGLAGHDPERRLTMKQIRNSAIRLCPDLGICRIIAVSGKHYQVDRDPDDAVSTIVYHSLDTRENEDFCRQRMFLSVAVDGVRQPAEEVFRRAIRFWEDLWAIASPGGRDYSGLRRMRGW